MHGVHDAPFLGEATSIHLHVPCSQCRCYLGLVLGSCPWAQAGPWQRARGDRGSGGPATRSVLALSRAGVHPASAPCSVGGTPQCMPLSSTEEKGML